MSSVAVRSVAAPRRSGKVLAGGGPLAGLDLAHPEGEVGEAVGRIAGDQLLGGAERVRQGAVGQQRDEGALDEFRVARVGLHRLAVEGRRRRRVPRRARDVGGEEVALERVRGLVVEHRGRFLRLRGEHGLREPGGEQQGERRNAPAGACHHHEPIAAPGRRPVGGRAREWRGIPEKTLGTLNPSRQPRKAKGWRGGCAGLVGRPVIASAAKRPRAAGRLPTERFTGLLRCARKDVSLGPSAEG